jgi:hypothetical protein
MFSFLSLYSLHGYGGKGIRTPGLLIANETLYQLSYTPENLYRKGLGKTYYGIDKVRGNRK